MKKTILVVVVIIFLLIGIKLFSPKNFVNDSEEIAKITIFDGSTGNFKEITDISEIKEIVSDFENLEFKISGVAFGRMGAGYRLEFYDKKEKVISKTIVNGEDTLRGTFFFYKPVKGAMNINRLRELAK